jgi:hypothetical protein
MSGFTYNRHSESVGLGSDSSPGDYSDRRTVMGSTDNALRAGARDAIAAVISSNSTAPAMNSKGLPVVPAQAARMRPRLALRTSPVAIPKPTPVPAEAATERMTSHGVAPNAMRIPNSLLRCATEYETTL